MYDCQEDAKENAYFNDQFFKGFSKKKFTYSIASIYQSFTSDVILLSHVHLIALGWIIKLLNSKKKIVLFVHGIEFWGRLSWLQSKMISSVDLFLPVSNFTSKQMQLNNQIDSRKIKLLKHCLDPVLIQKRNSNDPAVTKKKLGISDEDKMILSLCRISKTDRNKGYVKIIHSLVNIKSAYPSCKYVLAGPYTEEEKKYLECLASDLCVSNRLIITGYLSDDEIVSLFSIADVFILPSTKEGFGYVFVEALYYGLPVIAGNHDGSSDALYNGAFGKLIDVNDQVAIDDALIEVLSDKIKFIISRDQVLLQFNYLNYKNKLYDLLYY